jgi:16S rRNA (guanine966-N2)-methyltransferase
MRVIAGEFGGRRLKPPPDARVRPTADRVREAWFSILGDAIPGARVLDLFAGSGALGLEALSRGAAHVSFVELSPRSLATLRQNVTALGVADRVTVHRGDALRFVDRVAHREFDVALADPPYTTGQAEALRDRFTERPFARILCVEHASARPLDGGTTRRYGSVAITFFHAP